MRRIKLFIASSLDGLIARPDGAVDWLFTDGDYGMSAFLDTVDAIVYGRKTHEWMIAAGQPCFVGLKNYVFTRSHAEGESGGVTFVAGELADFASRLRGEPGKDIWLMGGGDLAAAFLDDGLVDEVIVAVHPLILGAGIPLFPRGRQVDLSLTGSVAYPSGLVRLSYDVRRPARAAIPREEPPGAKTR